MVHFGIEALSRKAKFAVFCDKSNDVVQIIKKNIEKTHLDKNCKIIKDSYERAIKKLSGEYKFDLIFIDPPYADNIAVDAIDKIISENLLSEDGIIILETDEKQRELENLAKLNVNVYDLRKYGRVELIFLNRKG